MKELFEQGAYQGRHADFAELKTWLLSKWMWNPELPMKPLLDDFFEGYYGKAAPYIRDYFEGIHAVQLARSLSPDKPLLIFDDVSKSAASQTFLTRVADDCWRKALEAVKDNPATSYNVRMAAFSVDYLKLERLRPKLAEASDEEKAEAKRLAKSLLERMDEAKDIRLAESLWRHDTILKAWRALATP